jgi:hypothetical protein
VVAFASHRSSINSSPKQPKMICLSILLISLLINVCLSTSTLTKEQHFQRYVECNLLLFLFSDSFLFQVFFSIYIVRQSVNSTATHGRLFIMVAYMPTLFSNEAAMVEIDKDTGAWKIIGKFHLPGVFGSPAYVERHSVFSHIYNKNNSIQAH